MLLLAQALESSLLQPPPILWAWLLFTMIIGACVGSFLNVVVYRIPEGKSVVTPPSACPNCNHGLAWYDNVPVLGWLWLRGKCRYCANPISIQYPLVEAFVALLFGAWFYVCYMTDLRPDFAGPGLDTTVWHLGVSLFLISCLVAATIIDARYYIIPMSITWCAAAAPVIVLPLVVWAMPWAVPTVVVPSAIDAKARYITREDRLEFIPPIYRDEVSVQWALHRVDGDTVEISAAPITSAPITAGVLGAFFGLIIALGLLHKRIIPLSFDEDSLAPAQSEDGPLAESLDDPESWPVHPHPRREVLKEALFLTFPIFGAAIALYLGANVIDTPAPLRVLGGIGLGYLLGAGVVWAIRIFGTLAFNKEAMGLGDMHLMAAVGAVCGWEVSITAFFVAPFLGLTWALASEGAARILKRKVKVIPYGPHLAVASLAVMVFREPILNYFRIYMTG